MVDLVGFLFQHWEDEETVEEGFANLAAFVRDEIDSDEAEEGWQLETLAQVEADAVAHADISFDNLIGAAAAARSPFTVDEHVATFGMKDQVWGNPTNWKSYTRHVVEGKIADFKNREGVLRTENDVETSLIGINIPYVLFKDFRWVEGDGDDDVLGRSWIAEISCNDGGGSCVNLSFSIDVWQGEGDETMRFTATWSDVESVIDPGDDFLIASLAAGIRSVFQHTDEFLAEP